MEEAVSAKSMSNVEGSEAVLATEAGVRVVVQQQPRDLHLVALGGGVERSVAAGGQPDVLVRPCHQQTVERVQLARPRSADHHVRHLSGRQVEVSALLWPKSFGRLIFQFKMLNLDDSISVHFFCFKTWGVLQQNKSLQLN